MSLEAFPERQHNLPPSPDVVDLSFGLGMDERWSDWFNQTYGKRSKTEINVQHWVEPKNDKYHRPVLHNGKPTFTPRHYLEGDAGAHLQGRVVGVKVISDWPSWSHGSMPVLELTNVYKISDDKKTPLQIHSNDSILVPFTSLGQTLNLQLS